MEFSLGSPVIDAHQPVHNARTAHVPVPDPRAYGIALDYADMNALVGELVLPRSASMHVMSAMETSRELIRHSYYRYEFATVAVTHSLFALEHVLAERLVVREPLRDLIERATDAGLIAPELDRCRLLRERLTQGVATSADLPLVRAIGMMRAVFDAISLLLDPPSAEEQTAADMSEPRPEDQLTRLKAEHWGAPFPVSFRGVEIGGAELILLDINVAGLIQRELNGGLDDEGITILWACISALDKVVPLINEEYCSAYFARLRTMARLVAARYTPAAT